MANQVVGETGWSNWAPMGVATYNAPNITTNIRGYSEISVLGRTSDSHSRAQFATFDPEMEQLSNWTWDATGWETDRALPVAADGEIIYALIDGLDGFGYWKVVYNNPNGEP
jgi:hypothetical protein